MISLREPAGDEVRRAIRQCGEDLTSVRERHLILRGIVRRARLLVGADMAYLSINDLTAGETYIAYSEGIKTGEYRNIRMQLGTGVLGAVAAGNRPVQTAAYLSDPEMNHLPEIDEIVRLEGVEAILGVPVRNAGRVVAALLVAHRESARFSDTTIEALTDIATCAGVAFEQIRLNRELNSVQAEVLSTQSTTRRRHHELESLLRLDDRLTSALIASTGLPGLVDVLVEAAGGPVGVYSPSGEFLSGIEVIDGKELCSPELSLKIAVSQRTQGATVTDGADGALLLMAAAAGEEHIATLVGAESPSMRAGLGRAAVFVTTVLLFERSLAEADSRAQAELIEDLIVADERGRQALLNRLAALGVDGTRGLTIAVCQIDGDVRNSATQSALREALSATPAVISPHVGHVCIVTAADAEPPQGDLGSRVHRALRRHGAHARIGTATASAIGDVAAAHREAEAVVNALHALGREHGHADALGLGIAGMLTANRDVRWVDSLITRVLGPVLEYDARNHTQLCFTAWQYLEHGGRLADVSRRLHVHANTVRQRADRLDSLLGDTWRRPPDSADVHFALRLWRLRQP